MPADADRLEQDCYEAYNIQVAGLVQRLRAIGGPKAVIGVSGGLDSTQAMLVAAKAMDRLGRPRSDVLAYTMPGFATGETSKSAALRLATALGATVEVLDIRPAAEQMLRDLHHPYADGERGDDVYDVTFENVQAGLRYDYLFRLANHRGGIVVGTGDLSEMALGWSTYGVGDQMSHYNVNAGVPKTLIQHLIRWVVASGQFDDDVALVLTEVLAAEISPEPGARPRRRGAEQRGEGRPVRACRTSRSSTWCATARCRRRSRSWRCTPGPTSKQVGGPRTSRTTSGTPTRWSRSGTGSTSSSAGSSASASSSGRRCRTARRSSTAGRSRRAVTGARRPTGSPQAWLDDLESVPRV
ncbi:hypothetical protein GCM10025868_19980 [Angustibacter aerolatus]|uniref:NAD/GMP synthase domain-containing protein n=1 Tax=Angustibacter aerolatus TaxID=1162965 RepID=A0ABQ6JH68_9ACTN|nr:hypothetical protein [Angustibacter aerolatus]GMA86748.1 hypothetical protein GCM10025868_19980 [Angustibacter aerolatus]